MPRIPLKIILILLSSVTACYGQSTFTKQEWEVISRNILDEHSENVALRALHKADSIEIQGLTIAYHYKNEALTAALNASKESDRIAQNWHSMYNIANVQMGVYQKGARRQKRKLVIVMVVSAIVVGLAVL